MGSQLPSPINLSAPSDKSLLAEWIPSFLAAMNKWMQQAVTAFKDLQGAGPSYKTLHLGPAPPQGRYPILFTPELNRPPVDVHVAQMRGFSFNAVWGIEWTLTSTGQVSINQIFGPIDSLSYEVVLSVS